MGTRGNDVAGFGEHLRQAREARKITLQDIAATTKIGSRALQALEDEQFDQLPGGIFNKGFVRAYARCVGLDEDKTVAAYMEAAKVSAPETDLQALSSQVTSAQEAARADSGMNAATLVGIVALIVALGLGALWLREQRKESREAAAQREAAVAAAAPVATPTPMPMVTPDAAAATPSPDPNATPNDGQTGTAANQSAGQLSGNQTATQSAAASQGKPAASAAKSALRVGSAVAEQSGAPVEISISATKRAWISVSSDGKTVATLTLDPEKPELSGRSFKAKEKLTLVMGNPAGVTVTYNGKPTGSLGSAGKPTTVTFTSEGMEKQ
jgi:cytoskeleton protein RodZ